MIQFLLVLLLILVVVGTLQVVLAGRTSTSSFPGSRKNEPEAPAEESGDAPAESPGAGPEAALEKAVQKAAATVPVPVSKHQLPEIHPKFFGRRLLLTKAFPRSDEAPKNLAFTGRMGIGKTSIALEVARRLLSVYGDAHIYLDVQGTRAQPRSVDEVMAHVVRTFHPADPLPEDREALEDRYRSTLAGKKVLLFLDNVPRALPVNELKPPNSCFLLLTAQEPVSAKDVTSLAVEPFETSEARDLLMSLSSRTGFWVSEISRLCSDLPLALSLCGHFLKSNTSTDPALYVEKLREEQFRLKRNGLKDLELSMVSVFHLNYKILSHKSALVLRKLTVFPRSFTDIAEEFTCEDEENLHLNILLSLGLVMVDTRSQRFFLHEQIRTFLEPKAGRGETLTAERRHATYYLTVLLSAHENFLKGGTLAERGSQVFDLEWDNIRAGQAWAEAHGPQDTEAARLASSYAEAAARLVPLRRPPREAIHWFEVGLHAARQLKDAEAEKTHLIHIGLGHNLQGDSAQAAEVLEAALPLCRQQADEAGERHTLRELGKAHQGLGKPHSALECFESELDLLRTAGDEREQETLLDLLANTYLEVGEIQRALNCKREELELARQHEDGHREGLILERLGELHASLNERQPAIEYFEQRLNLARDIGDREREPELLKRLGDAQLQFGEPRLALEPYEEALAMVTSRGDSPVVGTFLIRLGDAHTYLDDSEKGLKLYQKARTLFQKIGEKRREGEVLWKMSLAMVRDGKRDLAIDRARAALALLEPFDHPETPKIQEKLKLWVQAQDPEGTPSAEMG